MKSIRYRAPYDFAVENAREPEIGAHDLLVRPAFVGLCMTDRHWWDGSFGRPGGMIGGHEFSARVVAVGAEVQGDVAVGDRVSVEPWLRCGECDMCRAGFGSRCVKSPGMLGVREGCDGGLADLCRVPSYTCLKLPEEVSLEAAACVEPACTATRAVRHGGIRVGDNVIVFGGEDYALTALAWLRAAGVNTILAVDPYPHRRAAALSMGANAALDPADDVVLRAAIEEAMPAGADVAITACEDYVPATADYIASALSSLRLQGLLIPLRMYSREPFSRLSPSDLWLKEIQVRTFGVFSGHEPAQGGRERGDWQLTLDALADGRISAPPAGATRVHFDELRTTADVSAVFDSIPEDTTKVLVEVAGA